MRALLRSIPRTRVRTTAGWSGFTRNSSAPDSMPAISFSAPCTPVITRMGMSWVRRFGFEGAAEVRPAHAGHDHVHHDQVDLLVFQQFQGQGGPLGFQNAVGLGLQNGF